MSLLEQLKIWLGNGFALVMLLKSLSTLLQLKRGHLPRIILAVGCFLLVGMPIFIGDPVNILPTLVCFIGSVFFAYEDSPLQKMTIGLMFASTVFALNVLLDNFIPLIANTEPLARMISLGIFYLYIHHYAAGKRYELSAAFWKLLLYLTSIPLGIVLTIVVMVPGYLPLAVYHRRIYFILLLLALLTFVGLLRTITVLAKQQVLEQRSQLLEMDRKYYEVLEQQQFEVRRLKHDMTNHLSILHSLADNQREDYINSLLKTNAIVKTLQYCADPTVNAVINHKTGIMEQCGIYFHIKAEIPYILPFDKVDICTIFGNTLDNALEHCQKLPAGKREIHLETYIKKGIFAVKIKNPYLGKPLLLAPDDVPATSKTNRVEHGLGLKSVREIALRNQGHLEVKTDNQQFIVFIYIPVP